MPCYVFKADQMPDLVAALQDGGYRVVAPTIRDAAIVYDEIRSADEMPMGMIDHQNNGSYRLEEQKKTTWFAYNVGPTSWKKFLYPPRERIWQSQMIDNELHFREEPVDTTPTALLGARSCELRALAIHDKVFQEGS